MQWLAALCVRRPVFASVIILSLTVIGIFSFVQLGIDQFPNVDFPAIVVTTRLPGAAPEQVETEISDHIEEAVNTISGIDTLTSVSSEGVSQVVVGFNLEKNTDVAAQEVRDRGQPHSATAATNGAAADRREARSRRLSGSHDCGDG
jgi:HAE1 family hydrophobic/amphiphilic exporter-1